MSFSAHDVLNLFQGIATLIAGEPSVGVMRLFLIALGFVFIYLGRRGVLEALLMLPMGLGMIAVNGGVLFLEAGLPGTLFLNPLESGTDELMNILQINWLQPIYTLAFSNGLIACLVFMGLGVLLDVSFLMVRPFQSMIVALFAELGTIATFPIAIWLGYSPGAAAAISSVGGADGPMTLFISLILAKELFVPITVVAYLYLAFTYGGYPYLIRLMVPKRLRRIQPPPPKRNQIITSGQKMVFAVVMCTVLCLLFPMASPLLFSLFLGVLIKESGLQYFADLLSTTLLYGATLALGVLLGVLTEARTILHPQVTMLFVLGVTALLLSGIGGIIGGYVMYFWTGGKFNPVVGIAGVSCLPTCAKVAQKEVAKGVIVMPQALGICISGIITTAIIVGVYISFLRVVPTA